MEIYHFSTKKQEKHYIYIYFDQFIFIKDEWVRYFLSFGKIINYYFIKNKIKNLKYLSICILLN